MNKANECSCPSGDGSLVHPCPAHPAVEQAGGDERDFQAEGAQEVPSPVSQEYDRHLISLLRKGEALPGHQEEAADEIERLRDWNDHLNNTVLPNILNPTFLMLMKGGERLLDLCTKDGEFIGVSLNDMKDVFDWMVTHARIAPDQAALAQPSPAIATAPTYQFHSREIGESDWAPCDFSWYLYCSKSPEMDTRVVEVTAQPSPAQAEQAEAERPEVFGLERYRVERTGQGFWPYCVRAGDGTRELFVGHLKQCKRVAAQLATAFEDGKFVAGALRAENAKLIEALDESDGDRWRLRSERDAALARVAELENGTVYVEARQCYECHHGGINDSADGLAACHDCDWTGPEPDEDKCPGCHRENCMAAACPECGGRYELVADANIAAPPAQAQHLHDLDKQCRDDVARALGLRPNEERGFAWSYLLASIKSCVKAAEDTAQAQHSVPELLEWAVGRWHAEVSLRPLINVHRRALDDTWRQVIRRLGGDTGLLCGPSHDELLAAAPGTEVPQAWLDVQAERRRQITAEGWTPDHDDLYCAAELPRAAAAYILSGANDEAPAIWPFSAKWWKPRDARSNYVRAGALILAEIERLDRAAPGKEGNDD
ncbi:hypothetical protein [Pseudomonas aeruginosa]|uniref:hypothetical protein n=1 Tax=Pseudomonas aeruginosa TaxID=287 RepID=UPI002FF05013